MVCSKIVLFLKTDKNISLFYPVPSLVGENVGNINKGVAWRHHLIFLNRIKWMELIEFVFYGNGMVIFIALLMIPHPQPPLKCVRNRDCGCDQKDVSWFYSWFSEVNNKLITIQYAKCWNVRRYVINLRQRRQPKFDILFTTFCTTYKYGWNYHLCIWAVKQIYQYIEIRWWWNEMHQCSFFPSVFRFVWYKSNYFPS